MPRPFVHYCIGSGDKHVISGGRVVITQTIILFIYPVAFCAAIDMEDGSDEVLSGVMMIVLENNSEKDLQLARIHIGYTDFTAEFEVTNLPVGEKAVLLEKNRRSMPDKAYETVESSNVVFFEEKMSLMEEKFSIIIAIYILQKDLRTKHKEMLLW